MPSTPHSSIYVEYPFKNGLLLVPVSGPDGIDEVRGGPSGHQIHVHDLPAPGLHQVAPDDLVGGPIGALHQQVGPEDLDDFVGIVFREGGHEIHAIEGQEHLGTFGKGKEGFEGALDASDGIIRVEGHDQEVSHRAGGLQVRDMAGVQQVENTVGEDYLVAVVLTGFQEGG
jgi:hypothetical protein